MDRFRYRRPDRSEAIGLFFVLWLCCVLVAGGVLLAFFNWQVGAAGITVATAIIFWLAITVARD